MPPKGSQGGNELTTRTSRTFGALLLVCALFLSAVPAGAVPSKQEQARAVKAQIDKLDQRVEIAAEAYNEASSKHAKLLAEKKKAAAKLQKVQKRMDVVQRNLNTRANNMYRSGQSGFIEVLFGAQSYEEFATTWDVLTDLNTADAEAVEELKALRIEAKAAKKEYSEKEAAAKKQVAIMKSKKNSIEKQLAERKSKLRGLESEIAAIAAAEERARAARAARASSSSSGGRRFPAPTRAPRSEVVNIAMKYLGAPYQWGASGPNSFDCSGFTSFVYRQVGVSLPRTSRAQINAGQRVNRSDLKPGDLVFFGSPIHHVGIYVGGNRYINSPRTGDVVKISSMGRSDYSGACRP